MSKQIGRMCAAPTKMSAFAVAAGLITGVFGVAAQSHAGGEALQPRSGDPLPGLSAAQLDRFFKGKERFEHSFTTQEGLGPVFNRESCAVCHSIPAVGGSGSIAVTRFGALNFLDEFDPLEEFGGSLFQMSTIAEECADLIPTQQEVEDLLGFGWGAISDDKNAWFPAQQRITNSALGGGLVEAIADEDILAHAVFYGGLPHPGTPPAGPSANIAGRAHMVFSFEDEGGKEPPQPRVGRMGWKAQVATVLTFSADAARNELGLSNRFITQAPAPAGDLDLLDYCQNLKGINDLALHPNDQPQLDPYGENIEFIDRVTDFQRYLAAPPQTPKSGMTGEQVFHDIGCAQCHVSTWTTRDDPELEDAIRNKTIKPYSDFLLHNMGLSGDLIEQGDGGIQFMRTPSLWGLRNRDPLWHDGRVGGGSLADRIYLMPDNNIIHWHKQFGSTAADAAANFEALDQDEIDQLIAFLDSLGRREFDYNVSEFNNGDGFIDDEDFAAFIGCYTGTGGSYVGRGENPMDGPCAVFDFGQKGSIDHTDFELFLTVYQGMPTECELWIALADGVAPIEVPVPGECLGSTCGGDLTGDGSIGVPDLLELLAAWGPCEDCDADLTGDGTVGVPDLLELLSLWGPCPE